MKDKIERLRQKEAIVRAKIQLQGQKINLANRQRQLHKIQSQGFNFKPFSILGFVQQGNEVTENIFGLKKVRRK